MALSLESIMKDKILVTFDGESKNYVLSKDDILTKSSLFNILLQCNDKDKVLIHNEYTFSYDQFKIVYKILTNEKITASELKENEEILKFYMINNKNIIKDINPIFETDKFLFFNSEAKYDEALEFVKERKLPYLPFKAAFSKGGSDGAFIESYSGKNIPVYISFSEYNNIFLISDTRKIIDDKEEMYKYKKTPKYSYDNKIKSCYSLNAFLKDRSYYTYKHKNECKGFENIMY